MTFAILVGNRGGGLVTIGKPDAPSAIKNAFKDAVAANGIVSGKQYEELQVIASTSGRIKRKRFTVAEAHKE